MTRVYQTWEPEGLLIRDLAVTLPSIDKPSALRWQGQEPPSSKFGHQILLIFLQCSSMDICIATDADLSAVIA